MEQSRRQFRSRNRQKRAPTNQGRKFDVSRVGGIVRGSGPVEIELEDLRCFP
jgi:hypothetical protein